jgi:hypothetical protein
MDAERLQEIDRKIKRYEGIDVLLNHDLWEKENGAGNPEKTDDAVSQNARGNNNE